MSTPAATSPIAARSSHLHLQERVREITKLTRPQAAVSAVGRPALSSLAGRPNAPVTAAATLPLA